MCVSDFEDAGSAAEGPIAARVAALSVVEPPLPVVAEAAAAAVVAGAFVAAAGRRLPSVVVAAAARRTAAGGGLGKRVGQSVVEEIRLEGCSESSGVGW